MRHLIFIILLIHASSVLGQSIKTRAITYQQWLPAKYNFDSLWQEVKCSLNVEHSLIEINQFKEFYDKKCIPRYVSDPKWIGEQGKESIAKFRNADTYHRSIHNTLMIARKKSELTFLRDSIDCKIKFNKNHLLLYSITYSGCRTHLEKVSLFHNKKKKEYKFVVFLSEKGACDSFNLHDQMHLIPKIPRDAKVTFHYFYFSERIQRKR